MFLRDFFSVTGSFIDVARLVAFSFFGVAFIVFVSFALIRVTVALAWLLELDFVVSFFAATALLLQFKKSAYADCQVTVYHSPSYLSTLPDISLLKICYHSDMIVLLLNFLLFTVAIFIFWRLWRAFALYRLPKNLTVNIEKPSVSICIPARNEMHALTTCLEKVLASDYEKLEILVFDDSSADDTSVLIRSFAHAGVRFVPGTHLPQGWLGKNHALEVLAKEASGNVIVFMDVDTQVAPHTISQLVATVASQKLEMVSVIPFRADAWRASMLFGTLRYFWQLVLPGAHHPATSSAFWAINRTTLLKKLGGFVQFSSSVEPEAHLARRLLSDYRCLLAGKQLGVSFEKRWSSQCETSRRLLYPQFGGKWWSFLVGLVVLAVLNLPTFLVVSGILAGYGYILLPSLVALLTLMLLYGTYLTRAWTKGWLAGALLWPYVIFQELVLFILSAYSYWTHSVTWKGRSVTAAKTAQPAPDKV